MKMPNTNIVCVLSKKSTFWAGLTKILASLQLNEGIWAQKIANFMQGIKSAKLEIANFSKGHIFGFSFLFPIM